MQQKKINPIIQWWMTPKLPYHDIFELPLLINKSLLARYQHLLSQWVIHPIKRRLAKSYLKLLQETTDIKVIGITGSAGKTTTKEMLFSILKNEGRTVCTKTFLDPVYNLPNTILSTPFGTKYLILEMGVEYPGEMDFYLWLANPDIGVITNIYPTHTEFFGDVGGVFREKRKLVDSLSKSDIAVLNRKDKFLIQLAGKIKPKTFWFGDGTNTMSAQETIKGFSTEFTLIFDQDPKQKQHIRLPILGFQYVQNALAAAAVSRELEVSLEKIKNGLEEFNPQIHRMHAIKLKSGAIILDDSYNNNPQAAKEAINTLFQYSRSGDDRIVVFGDMLELGNLEEKYHKELGEYLSKFPFLTRLICVGNASKVTADSASEYLGKARVVSVQTWKEVIKEISPYLKPKTVVLIKGSRSVGLDKLVDALV